MGTPTGKQFVMSHVIENLNKKSIYVSSLYRKSIGMEVTKTIKELTSKFRYLLIVINCNYYSLSLSKSF